MVTGLYIREFRFHGRGSDFPMSLLLGLFDSGPRCLQFQSKLQFLRILRDDACFGWFLGDRTPDCRLL